MDSDFGAGGSQRVNARCQNPSSWEREGTAAVVGGKLTTRLIGERERSGDNGLVLPSRPAIIWMSYKIQPDPINMPPDREPLINLI